MSDPVVDEVRAKVIALNADRDDALAQLGTVAAQVSAAGDAARALAAAGDADGARASLADQAAARTSRRELLTRISGIDSDVVSATGELVAAGIDPCDGEPDVPILLLPVRLETRFTADGTALRVRIYPDDAHVDRLETGLSAAEVTAGQAFWTAAWSGASTDELAWAGLKQAVHPGRASWVATALTPTNLADRPDPPAAAPAPAFPEVAPPTLRPAVARALPDRFVVTVEQAGTTTSLTGNPVPPEVVVGLPPDDDPTVLISQGGATLGPGMEWMTDFAEAERIGLGVTVPLAVPGAPVERVLVLGVRTSLDPACTAAEVRLLLSAHRYAEGSAVLAQGTPTNNTETDRAAWTRRPDPVMPATRADQAQVAAGSSADRLATALGVGSDLFAGLDGADVDQQALPAAVNAALWSATWGTFFTRMGATLPGGGLDDSRREELRDMFAGLVRGRGPLPALRLGNQPYGVLPVSDLSTGWGVAGTELEGEMVAMVQRLRALVAPGTSGVPSVVGAARVDDALLEVLGSAPLALGVRVRSVASQATCSMIPPLLGLGIGDVDTELQAVLDAILWQSLGLPPGAPGLSGTLGKTTRPVGLPLVHDSDPAFIAALPDSPRTVASVLQALLELALDADQRAVDAAAPDEQLGKLLELGAAVEQNDIGRLRETVSVTMQGRVDPTRLHAVADDLAHRVGPAGPARLAQQNPVVLTRGTLADSAVMEGFSAQAAGVMALQSIQAWLRAKARLAQTTEALKVIADASTADRAYATAEALDCCSHRLDAWLTAPVTRQLGAMRAATPEGLLVGAYGWVEDLVPGAGTVRDGGYLLAPSLVHAATAGVLRSAYLGHNPDAGSSGAFATDLTSTRVRHALAVLDGVRSGQPLGALLGYRFERQLRESPHGIERFVASLRALAPLSVGRLADRAEAPPQQAREAVTANNVVDGVALLALRDGGTDIRGALGVPPKNNPYLAPDHPWPPPTQDEWDAISAAMAGIAEDRDAVADLLMAEGVHQLVQGNTARAAAVLDAAASGDAPPPDPQVVQIPPRGAGITHRLLLLVRDVATGAGGWSVTTPRAVAEPRLAAWAEAALGPATEVVVQVAADGSRTTLDSAGLAAIDVVHDSAPGVLERRVRTAVPGLGAGPLAGARDPAWPAGLRAFGEVVALATSLRRLVVGADPALPPALTRTGDRAARTVGLAAVSDVRQRATDAATGLGTARDAVVAALAVQPVDATLLAVAVDGVAAYGVPLSGDPGDPVTALAAQVEATRRVDAAVAALAAGTDLPASSAAVDAVFGAGFLVLPVITAGPPDLFGASFGAVDPGAGPLRRFVRDLASVRPAMGRYADSLLLCDALGRGRSLTVAQLAPAGVRGADRWLGLPFSGQHPSPELPVTVALVESPDALAGRDAVAGLVVDEWLEVVPKVVERSDGAGGTVREPMLTAGVAANVDVPGTRAPQAMLLAISPDGARWTTPALTGVLTSTLDLAKLRAVTLERAPWLGRVLPALLEQSWSLQGEKTVDLRLLLTKIASTDQMIRFVKE